MGDHPLIFDALAAVARTGATEPSFDELVRELQNAGGRSQIVLRDIVLDRGAYSSLSYDSKVTPCFRVEQSADFKMEIFGGIRGSSSSLLWLNLNENIFADEDGCFAEPTQSVFDGKSVKEVFLRSGSPNEIAAFDSDVTWQIEECPQ